MKSFIYHNPTKIIFGDNTVQKIGQELAGKAKKVLFIYGKSSIKANGVYDTVVKSLKDNNIEWIEHPGVTPNPLLSHANEGVKIVKDNNIDAILAVGGGSVIDEAKSIAAGAKYDGCVWDLITNTSPINDTLPVYTILTIPATGSEMNSTFVLTNDETFDKFGCANPKLYPVVSILDPIVTLTIPKDQTAYTSIDIIAHSIEAYFTKEDNDTPYQDGYIENIVKNVILAAERLLINPKDLNARATLMWCATSAWNGTNHCGVGAFYMNNHQIEAPMSGLYDIAHGAGLGIIIPAWMKYFKQQKYAKLQQFFKAIYNDSDVDKGIETFENWIKKIGAPAYFSESTITDPDIDKLTEMAVKSGEQRGTNLSESDIRSIYTLAK